MIRGWTICPAVRS